MLFRSPRTTNSAPRTLESAPAHHRKHGGRCVCRGLVGAGRFVRSGRHRRTQGAGGPFSLPRLGGSPALSALTILHQKGSGPRFAQLPKSEPFAILVRLLPYRFRAQKTGGHDWSYGFESRSRDFSGRRQLARRRFLFSGALVVRQTVRFWGGQKRNAARVHFSLRPLRPPVKMFSHELPRSQCFEQEFAGAQRFGKTRRELPGHKNPESSRYFSSRHFLCALCDLL